MYFSDFTKKLSDLTNPFSISRAEGKRSRVSVGAGKFLVCGLKGVFFDVWVNFLIYASVLKIYLLKPRFAQLSFAMQSHHWS